MPTPPEISVTSPAAPPPHSSPVSADKCTPRPGRLARAGRTLSSHFGLIVMVGIALLLPLRLVNDLVTERAQVYKQVVADISRTWGGTQEIAGPFLIIPFNNRETVERIVRRDNGEVEKINETQNVTKNIVILPSTVSMKVSLEPQERQRGIYRTLVYTSGLSMHGQFTLPSRDEFLRAAPGLDAVDYSKAYVVVGLRYPSALRDVDDFIWNGSPLQAEPGIQPARMLKAGYKVPVPLAQGTRNYAFSQTITFNGSEGIRFIPTGGITHINMTSPWPHPSFQGAVLPTEREVTPQGFAATWRIPSLARTYPNIGMIADYQNTLNNFHVGVDLYEMSTHYKLIHRATKYGVLFIGLTFLALIVFEMGMGVRLHPVQYGLVGLAMVVFYLVLLSLSEHVAFRTSYAAGAACIALMISSYVGAAARSVRQGTGIGVLLTGLSTLLYAILQLEDYALLMGTALVLLMLAALMVVSRHVNRDVN